MIVQIRYNSPVILTFALLSFSVLILTLPNFYPDLLHIYFATPTQFNTSSILSWVQLFSHIFGHANWNHFINNFMMILLIGPICEEKYGSLSLLCMILITAGITGTIQVFLVPDAVLIGASGIVFMLIMLVSITNIQRNEIPITFFLVLVLYLLREIIQWLNPEIDYISHMAHTIGGFFGALFGLLFPKKTKTKKAVLDIPQKWENSSKKNPLEESKIIKSSANSVQNNNSSDRDLDSFLQI